MADFVDPDLNSSTPSATSPPPKGVGEPVGLPDRVSAWTETTAEITISGGPMVRQAISIRLPDGRSGRLVRGHIGSPLTAQAGRVYMSQGPKPLVVVPFNRRIYSFRPGHT